MKQKQLEIAFNSIALGLGKRLIDINRPSTFISNVSRQDRNTLRHLMDIQECNHHGTYLGHPFCKFKSKCEAYKYLIEKLENKLVGWKQKCLSMAGQMVLIKTVAQAIMNYITQTFLLPKNILHKMDSIIRNLYWGFKNSNDHHLYLKSWNTICLPKTSCGLGLRKMEEINQALISKLAWNLATPSDKPGINMLEGHRRTTAGS